jgi:hypothetical protein
VDVKAATALYILYGELLMKYTGWRQNDVGAQGGYAREGVKQSTFCMARRKSMITMGSPYFVWINTNEMISSWYLLGAVCVAPPGYAWRRRSASLAAAASSSSHLLAWVHPYSSPPSILSGMRLLVTLGDRAVITEEL